MEPHGTKKKATELVRSKLDKRRKPKKHKFNGNNRGSVTLDNTGRSIGKKY